MRPDTLTYSAEKPMSNVKHTPGPWRVVPATNKGTVLFHTVDPDGNGRWRGSVASVHSAEHIMGISIEERDANARLIAAAPELLAVAKAALAFIDSHVADPDITEEMAANYIALRLLEPHEVVAKAEGRT
jgi:hypothetical protein